MLSALLALRLAVAGANAQVRELPPYPIARYAVGSIAAPGREAALGLELGAALPAWPSNSYTLSIPQALPAASAAPAALPAAAAAAAPILPATAPQAAEPAGAEQRPSAESASAQAARRFDGLPAAPADESKSYWVTLEPGTAVERLWDNEGSPIDSAVELELDMSPAVMALITTDDGTLHPLLDGISAPGWLKKIKAARDRRPADLADLKWDELSYSQQRRLILHDSAARRAKFGATAATRKIRGLKTRTSWTINLRRSTILFGKRYPKGRQVVDLPGILEPNVEYGNPNSVRTLELVELHLRGNFRAGRLSGDAWTLLRAAGIPLTHQHVHSVAPLPAAIKSHNALAVITLAERQRVLETAAHMIAIVHERRSVIEGKDEQGNIFFAPMDRSQLHKLVTTLLSYRFN
ncbi:MAG: hypothetical protein KGK30_08435, partial [Elusimicrobia bacterium]|nr:hypothetical protein [Elusimicrobiota bacterium]